MNSRSAHGSGRLQSRVAIVTGASRGIGAAVARRFAAEGARVAVHHHPDHEMAQLAQDVVSEILAVGGIAVAVGADLRRPDEIDAMVATVTEELGDARILVANAAVLPRKPWSQIGIDEWNETFAVNVTGTFWSARAVHPGMLRLGGGSIITVSSVTVHVGSPGMLDYVSSKAAIVGLTRALAREVGGDDIRVNAVMPGFIRTEHELEHDLDEEANAALAARLQSLPRRGYADDLSGTFVYLASEDSDFMTGQVLAVDGGWVHR